MFEVLSASEIIRESFNFSVDRFPLSGPEGMKTPVYGLFRSDNGEYVGKPVTNRYIPHTTEDVIALVEAAETAFDGDIYVKTHFKEGHYVTVQPCKEERLAVYGSADNAFPRVVINASYDGRSFRASIGYYRDLCKNLAMLQSVQSTSVSIRHLGSLRDNMDELISTFGILKESWATLSDVILRMESTEVNIADFLDSVYGKPDEESKRSVSIHRNRTEAMWRRLNTERNKSGRPQLKDTVSAWEAFNVVQGYTQHTTRRRLSEYDRIIKTFEDPTVQRAERLALSLSA